MEFTIPVPFSPTHNAMGEIKRRACYFLKNISSKSVVYNTPIVSGFGLQLMRADARMLICSKKLKVDDLRSYSVYWLNHNIFIFFRIEKNGGHILLLISQNNYDDRELANELHIRPSIRHRRCDKLIYFSIASIFII